MDNIKKEHSLESLRNQINNSKIDEKGKKRLLTVLDGILESDSGMLFTKNGEYLKEFITLKSGKQLSQNDLDFCIGQMSTRFGEEPKYNFHSLPYLSDYIELYEKELLSEIENAKNSPKMAPTTQETPAKDPISQFRAQALSDFNAMQMPEDQKKRLCDMLEVILNSPTRKIYSVAQPSYEECIAVRRSEYPGDKNLGFCITKRMIDTYSGATAGRMPNQFISTKRLKEYVEEHKLAIDKQIERFKILHPERKAELLQSIQSHQSELKKLEAELDERKINPNVQHEDSLDR